MLHTKHYAEAAQNERRSEIEAGGAGLQSFAKDTFFCWGDGRPEEGDLKIDLATPLALLPPPVSAPLLTPLSGLLVAQAASRGVRCPEKPLRSLNAPRAGNGDGVGLIVGDCDGTEAGVMERALSSPLRLGGGVDPGGATGPGGGRAEVLHTPARSNLGKGGGRQAAGSDAFAAAGTSRATAAGPGGGRSAIAPAVRAAAALDTGWCCNTALDRRNGRAWLSSAEWKLKVRLAIKECAPRARSLSDTSCILHCDMVALGSSLLLKSPPCLSKLTDATPLPNGLTTTSPTLPGRSNIFLAASRSWHMKRSWHLSKSLWQVGLPPTLLLRMPAPEDIFKAHGTIPHPR